LETGGEPAFEVGLGEEAGPARSTRRRTATAIARAILAPSAAEIIAGAAVSKLTTAIGGVGTRRGVGTRAGLQQGASDEAGAGPRGSLDHCQ
jgi:hypothetical protein